MDVRIINLSKIVDKRGNLTFLQNERGLPFEIKRVFWTYDVASGEKRGGHAYKTQNEVICVVSGSVDIILRDKQGEKKFFSLNRPDRAIFIPKRIWRHMENFATNTVTVHFSDSSFDANDYIRNFEEI